MSASSRWTGPRIARALRARAATLRGSAALWRRHRSDAGPRIFYLLTPPPRLANVGDHAQVVAIRQWIDRHYPGRTVVEVDKDQQRHLLPAIRYLARPDDLVLLHSGGNLGDRGWLSESARRAAIAALPANAVVSLPQTIHFSRTPHGEEQRAITRAVYGAHRRLMVIGRDPVSGEAAAELFPAADTFALPDFVLSLPPHPAAAATSPPAPAGDHSRRPSLLLCLRRDDESALSAADVAVLQALPYGTTRYDTTLDREIPPERRRQELDDALHLFSAADVVVTDRFHGLIFGVLCRRPVVVLATVDHKLTSAIHWFDGMPWVRFADAVEQVEQLVADSLGQDTSTAPDFGALYFDPLPGRIATALDVA